MKLKGQHFLATLGTDEYQQNITSSFKQIVKFSDVEEAQDTDEIIVLSTNEHTLEIPYSLYEFIHLSLPSKRTHTIEADCNQEVLEKLDELALRARSNRPTLVSTSKIE